MPEKKQSQEEHQRELARSGYRLPDNFYSEPVPEQKSAEEKSGDGGAAASKGEQKSEHGYKGHLKTQQELQEDADAARTVDPDTGLTIPGAAEEQAEANRPKGGTGPTENKADKAGKRK